MEEKIQQGGVLVTASQYLPGRKHQLLSEQRIGMTTKGLALKADTSD